jgi:hypothetical protein
MRVRLDRKLDRATVYLSEERQSYEHGGTYLVMTQPVEIQLGFEGERRLISVMVCPASEVLPPSLLEQAEEAQS